MRACCSRSCDGVRIIPPSPQVITLVGKKENPAACPNAPGGWPCRLEPCAWAASSTRATPAAAHIRLRSAAAGVMRPPMCTSIDGGGQRRQSRRHRLRAQREGDRVDVSEHRPAPGSQHRLGSREEGVGGHHDLAARDADAPQHDLQRRGPAGNRDRARRRAARPAVRRREGSLKPPGIGTEGEVAAGQDLRGRGGDLLSVRCREHDASCLHCQPDPPAVSGLVTWPYSQVITRRGRTSTQRVQWQGVQLPFPDRRPGA